MFLHMQKTPVQKENWVLILILSDSKNVKIKADDLFATYGGDLEHFYTGENTNWKQIYDASKMAEELSERVSLICNISSIRNEIGNIRSLDRIVDDLIHAWNSFGQQKKSIYDSLKLVIPALRLGYLNKKRFARLCVTTKIN